MFKFFNSDIADLAEQLTRSPRRLRMEQIQGIETLLSVVEPDRAYPFDFVCYHITKFRKRGSSTSDSIPGRALIQDLVSMAEMISRKANLTAHEFTEAFRSQKEVADSFNVSTKTVRRWRDRGLMGIRIVFVDGVNRLAFLEQSLNRFVKSHAELVQRGTCFRQLTDEERGKLVERARALVAAQPIKLHVAAQRIAEETGRAVETIRYTLRRYDSANPATSVFSNRARSIHSERNLAIEKCRMAGETPKEIARAFDCSVVEIEQALRTNCVQRWSREKWEFVPCELFDTPDADTIILRTPEPPPQQCKTIKIPPGLPAYLQSLYATPLFSTELERDLFRRYNYVKFKIASQLASLDAMTVSQTQHDELRELILLCQSLKKRIVQANLRLVVSIARKHVGWSPRFFENISDGNVSLMRAVEKFDLARGTKFSTYATWAIVKNFARTVPADRYHGTRFVTGQDELLHQAPDQGDAPKSESDRSRVRELIQEGLATLPAREQEIVAGHFGLNGDDGPMTLEQIGKRFGVTKERIRQIEHRALQRLRETLSPSLIEALAG